MNIDPRHPTFAEAFRFWLKLGFISFGGPTGQIAILHTELVEKRRWIGEQRFLHALNYCMLLPGPEATQLATYAGWLLHRTWGGIVAGTLSIALLAFAGLFFFKLPFPILVLGAGVAGLIGGRFWKEKFVVSASRTGPNTAASVLGDDAAAPAHTKPSLARAGRVCLICLTLWWTPVLALGAWLGFDHTFVKEGLFFSKAAMVTFGGAYAVLPYVSQQAVEQHGWLTAGQMLDGLGLAETTPGPLIMVLQFVGFLGAWCSHAPLTPLAAGTLGAFITTWTTFVPCFLWIFLGAPHVEQLRGNAKLTAALSAITAAVVGVVLNLAVWFGVHVLFPDGGPINWFGVGVCLVAFAGIVRWKWDIIPVVLGAGTLGALHRLVG